MKKTIKLYNLIFPIWMVLFFPPVIFISLIGNYIIDSLVVIGCFFAYKLANKDFNLKTIYKKRILKVWLYGFLSDFIGAAILLILYFLVGILNLSGLPAEAILATAYDPSVQPLAFIIILLCIFISAAFIFLFNYKFVFKNQIKEKIIRFKISLTIAIITAPWTFLLPTKWFY
ncbi:hypothetical protein [Clostridium sp. Marseille-Q2269]|uniref:hypothetical protein n=1 Tax=Clostridium sp. Marseille-Q2269 TaxID=2942205 RepID=UPI002072FD72|nr:hypothetical protein [Clostridium sp. Marseille-Q2269]